MSKYKTKAYGMVVNILTPISLKFKLEVAMDLPDIKEANSNLQHPAGTLVKPTPGGGQSKGWRDALTETVQVVLTGKASTRRKKDGGDS